VGEKQPQRQGADRIEWFTVSYRTLALAAVALVLLGLAVWLLYGQKTPPPPPQPTSVATGSRFERIEGSVQVKRAGTLEWIPATKAVVLRQNDLVRTGSGSTAEIKFADGFLFNVRPDSLITIEESSQNPLSRQQNVKLSIQSGEANFLTAASNVPGSTTTISTPTVRTTPDRETAGSIQVAENGATGLRIFRGQSGAVTKDGQRIALGSNQGVNVDAGGKAGATVNLPSVPVLTAPPNQTEVAYPDLQQGVTLLVWNSVPGATGYRVLVDFSPAFARPLYDRQGVRTTQLELRALEAGSYYWKVAALDTAGSEGGFSDLWRFALSKAAQSAAAPPPLVIDTAELRDNVLHVRGRTEAGTNLTVNGERLEVQPDGSFSEFVTFDGGANATVVVKATNPRGGVAEQRRRVTVAN
jgi:glucodextranase-like protein/FecR-like protein